MIHISVAIAEYRDRLLQLRRLREEARHIDGRGAHDKEDVFRTLGDLERWRDGKREQEGEE